MNTTNFTLKKGDTHYLEVVVSRKDENDVEQRVDITGASLWFTAKEKQTDADGDAFIRKGTTNESLAGIDITNAVDGEALVTLMPGDTLTAQSGTKILFWDLQLKEADDTITTINSGRIALVDQITVSA